MSILGRRENLITTKTIYQIGSSDPETAVQAAKTVMNDVSGIDLNCGCPRPFSTHSGMGAALLTNPDLLCAILAALREAMPPEITVTAKIRLLPSQEDTLKLVERIVNTGITALTVHCHTRKMRDKDHARIDRLREIVDFVEGMGKGIAVVENGDCTGFRDAKRVREVTGAHSVMIARALFTAFCTCASAKTRRNHETWSYHKYRKTNARYCQNHWALTKFCTAAFKGSHSTQTKKDQIAVRQRIIAAKGFDELKDMVGSWTGGEEL
ncbi:dihydrouridine synthase-domain-containing protein [Mycena floridula]|nr:dihydrouridine synthase-domain-containing protein [Mycena floridula]